MKINLMNWIKYNTNDNFNNKNYVSNKVEISQQVPK